MKKFYVLSSIILALLNTSSLAISNNLHSKRSQLITAQRIAIVKAEKGYSAGNSSLLDKLYKANPQSITVAYFYAKAMLDKNKPTFAENFVATTTNSYMRNDIIHQLLIFYFNNNSFSSYIQAFNKLALNQTSVNEKCGYDLANIVTQTTVQKRIISNAWLIRNNIPAWCGNLGATLYKKEQLSNTQYNLMLYNLLANGKTDIANQVMGIIGIRSINFAHYKSTNVNDLPDNRNYPYLVVNQVTTIAKKDPNKAYTQMKQASLDADTKAFLADFLAMQFALKQQFAQAKSLYDKYADAKLSDEEYEWLVRTLLYFNNWGDIISTINKMPEPLSHKNVWLYWLAKAYANTGQTGKAQNLFKQIPKDYSYYSMLAEGELGEDTQFKTNPSGSINLDVSDLTRQAQIAIALYQLGKTNNNRNLANIGSAEWNYAAKQSDDDNELLSMSNLARNHQFYDLSIFAANQMESRYISLSFPMPFSVTYTKYSSLFDIEQTYPLAVSRQESRFNYSAIAFDGGVGLMQIMPQTGTYIAQKSRSKNCFRQNAECNIKFGSWYLGTLFYKFNKNLIYSTAAYNAGPTRSKRWQDKIGALDNKVQIELIPISVTRDYVQKVLTNKAAYDAEINRKATINLLTYIDSLNNNRYLKQIDDDHTDAQKLN